MRVQRFLCPGRRATFSMLPLCMAASACGTLAAVEQAVDRVESEATMRAAVAAVRSEEHIDPHGVERWLRRRREGVWQCLRLVITLFPDRFGERQPRLADFRRGAGCDPVLVRLRLALGSTALQTLPTPAGFFRRRPGAAAPAPGRTHTSGLDPPPGNP